jgi:hypothetical protein
LISLLSIGYAEGSKRRNTDYAVGRIKHYSILALVLSLDLEVDAASKMRHQSA